MTNDNVPLRKAFVTCQIRVPSSRTVSWINQLPDLWAVADGMHQRAAKFEEMSKPPGKLHYPFIFNVQGNITPSPKVILSAVNYLGVLQGRDKTRHRWMTTEVDSYSRGETVQPDSETITNTGHNNNTTNKRCVVCTNRRQTAHKSITTSSSEPAALTPCGSSPSLLLWILDL
ncbi:hypothetical protein J6590_034021 [Homalodisca vitripennis]|nr:hypothetical protein J6590_034021 [Homalodisca vitripennis]